MRQSGGSFYRPVLLLTATNLSKRRLELISSADPRYADLPVAAAVRASAGFPVFFRPHELPDCPGGGWFVDGGVVANFPIWTFSDAFRDQIRTHDLYGWIASRPWMRIGLGLTDDADIQRDVSTPKLFLGALFGMLTGVARNELEDALARSAPRALVLRQPVSSAGAPADILDVPAIDGARITDMVEKGHQFAVARIRQAGAPGIYGAWNHVELRLEIETLISECKLILAPHGDAAKLRANIFVPVQLKLQMLVSCNMDGDPDDGLIFPDLSSGLNGACYQARAAMICNLEKVAQLAQSPAPRHLRPFRMARELQDRIKPDRSWMASVPIFDPYEVGTPDGRARLLASELQVAARRRPVNLDGPVLGIVNLDAGWDYARMGLDPDPDIHVSDPRIAAILSLMEAKTLILARLMTIITA